MNIYSNIDNFLDQNSESQAQTAVFEKNVLFPFFFKKTISDKYVFFLPGAYNRNLSMPKFQRKKHFEFLPYNCYSFFDPTLFLNSYKKFNIGWFQGTKDVFYAKLLADIIKKIIIKFKINPENILIFSTSSGGIPAFNVAEEIQDCNVFCSNIQTNILNFYKSKYEVTFNYCYPCLSLNEIKNRFESRFSINHIDNNFNLYYSQNIEDYFHFVNHFSPYLNAINKIKKIKLKALVYDDILSGHNPLSIDKELNIIKEILEKKSFINSYKDILISYDSFNLS